MSTIQSYVNALSGLPGLGLPEIFESKFGWQYNLLSHRAQKDLVTLHIGKIQNGDHLIISESGFTENPKISSVSEMVNANLISMGYPLYYIKEALGLKNIPLDTSYSLLYRSASLVLEAERLHIKNTVLILETNEVTPIVNNFYKKFTKLFCDGGQLNCFHQSELQGRARFFFGLFESNQH